MTYQRSIHLRSKLRSVLECCYKQNGKDKVGNGQPPIAHLEIKRTVIIPRCQTELDRRRMARREQPRTPQRKNQKNPDILKLWIQWKK